MKVFLHMKSGRTIKIPLVKNMSYTNNGTEITEIYIEHRLMFMRRFFNLHLIGAINLKSIESISAKRFLGIW